MPFPENMYIKFKFTSLIVDYFTEGHFELIYYLRKERYNFVTAKHFS